MSRKKTIMVVEDENNICKFINALLKTNDYTVVTAPDGDTALTMIPSYVPDVILLDLGLPDIDGLDIIKDIRKWSNIPIIVVSAREHENDKITALDAGADDYLTKPFSVEELLARLRVTQRMLARIRTSLRHKRMNLDEGLEKIKTYQSKDLKVDFEKYMVTVREEAVHLTNIEFKIIELLSKYSGKVLTYDYILKEIWGPFASEDNKTLRVNMANLRRKLEKNPAEPEYLFTEPGVGYRMAESE